MDGDFSWVGPDWHKELRYQANSLVTKVFLRHEALSVELRCRDAVSFDSNIYVKEVEVTNLERTERQVRLFFAHDFHLYGSDIGDTAYFDPRTRSIIHYKANRYFLINGGEAGHWGVEYFACDIKEVPGRQATWQDAEDGELSGSPIAWGSADSTIGIRLRLTPGGSATAYYWVAAGTRYHEVTRLNDIVVEQTPTRLIKATAHYWGAWVQKESRSFGDLPTTVIDVFHRSLLILRTQIDNRGAITAANDSDIVRFGKDTYSYMWGRDGAFVAAALARAGYADVCRRFFDFCSDVLSEEGYLLQHYNPDGSLASTWHPWVVDGHEVLPIQEDSTALVLWALWLHYERSNDIELIGPLYKKLIQKAADFLVTYRDAETRLPMPSYDLWEERYGTHAFTIAAVIAGLSAAAKFARLFQDISLADTYEGVAGHMREALTKHLYHTGLQRYARSGSRSGDGYELDEVIDVSLLGLVTLGALAPRDPRVLQTIEAVQDQLWLKTAVGGCARYQNDRYQRAADGPDEIPGNPWFISTLWLGECMIARAESLRELHEAVPYLEWCAKNALPSGVLAEQVHPANGSPLSVSPLTWSHSAFVWAVLQYAERFNSLQT